MLLFPLIHPPLLAALAACGHGGKVLIADANYSHSTNVSPRAALIYLNLRPGLDPLDGWNNVGDKAPNAVAHNHLLVSIAQAFDQNIMTFGKADYVGPLSGLT